MAKRPQRPSAKELRAMRDLFVPRRSWVSEPPSSRVKEIARDRPRPYVPPKAKRGKR
jgi:hypothetical protein